MNKNIVYNIIKGRELDPLPCKECGVRPNMRHGSADWIEHAVVIVCVNPNCPEYGYQTVGDPEYIDNTIEAWNHEQEGFAEEMAFDEDYAYEQITQDPSLLLSVLDGKVRADLKDDEVR